MKNKSLFLILLMILTIPSLKAAEETTDIVVEEELLDPGLKKGDFFYFTDKATENLDLFFTFDRKEKLEKRLKYVNERLAESNALYDENKEEYANETLDEYILELERTTELISEDLLAGINQEDLIEEINRLNDRSDAIIETKVKNEKVKEKLENKKADILLTTLAADKYGEKETAEKVKSLREEGKEFKEISKIIELSELSGLTIEEIKTRLETISYEELLIELGYTTGDVISKSIEDKIQHFQTRIESDTANDVSKEKLTELITQFQVRKDVNQAKTVVKQLFEETRQLLDDETLTEEEKTVLREQMDEIKLQKKEIIKNSRRKTTENTKNKQSLEDAINKMKNDYKIDSRDDQTETTEYATEDILNKKIVALRERYSNAGTTLDPVESLLRTYYANGQVSVTALEEKIEELENTYLRDDTDIDDDATTDTDDDTTTDTDDDTTTDTDDATTDTDNDTTTDTDDDTTTDTDDDTTTDTDDDTTTDTDDDTTTDTDDDTTTDTDDDPTTDTDDDPTTDTDDDTTTDTDEGTVNQ